MKNLTQRDRMFILLQTFKNQMVLDSIFFHNWDRHVSPWILDGGTTFNSILDIIGYGEVNSS